MTTPERCFRVLAKCEFPIALRPTVSGAASVLELPMRRVSRCCPSWSEHLDPGSSILIVDTEKSETSRQSRRRYRLRWPHLETVHNI